MKEIPGDLKIECRPVEICQLLLNLLNNAHDAVENSQTKWIEIVIRDFDDKIELTISDSGPGVPDRIKDKIMEPFFTTKPKGKGTGLGLNISRNIVEKHEGTMALDQSLLKTQFIIRLPKYQQKEETSPNSQLDTSL